MEAVSSLRPTVTTGCRSPLHGPGAVGLLRAVATLDRTGRRWGCCAMIQAARRAPTGLVGHPRRLIVSPETWGLMPSAACTGRGDRRTGQGGNDSATGDAGSDRSRAGAARTGCSATPAARSPGWPGGRSPARAVRQRPAERRRLERPHGRRLQQGPHVRRRRQRPDARRAGNDRLKGGSGKDEIDVGTARNVALGGSGNDRILAANSRRDRISAARATTGSAPTQPIAYRPTARWSVASTAAEIAGAGSSPAPARPTITDEELEVLTIASRSRWALRYGVRAS